MINGEGGDREKRETKVEGDVKISLVERIDHIMYHQTCQFKLCL